MSSKVHIVEPKTEGASMLMHTPNNTKVDCPTTSQIEKEERAYMKYVAPYIGTGHIS